MDVNLFNRKRGLEAQDNVTWHVPKIGRTQTCYFYETVNCDKDNTMVFEVSIAYARSEIWDEKESDCYFGSALCAFCPDLSSVVMDALQYHGIEPKVITLPSEARTFGVNLEKNTSKYDLFKIYTILGSCLIMLFINNVNVISDEFMRNTVYALAKKLCMPEGKITELGEEILPAQAKAIYNVFGSNDALKNEVEEFLR